MTKIQYENLTIRQAEVADAKQLAACLLYTSDAADEL